MQRYYFFSYKAKNDLSVNLEYYCITLQEMRTNTTYLSFIK